MRQKPGEMKLRNVCNFTNTIFSHCLYEYKKGLRHLALCTVPKCEKVEIVKRLKRENISYYIQEVNESKINVFFGHNVCIEIVKLIIGDSSLKDLTDEEDFILGTMLGYDRLQQCERYIKRKQRYRKAINFLNMC